jgi:thymidine kinase
VHTRAVLEVIAGPMFSGKTDELLRRAAEGVLVKPRVDDRHATREVVSHAGVRAPALVVASSAEIPEAVGGAELVGVDEGQFFDAGLVEVARRLADGGTHVVVAALDRDFRAQSFPVSAGLIELADRVDILVAECGRCGAAATLTQRLRGGEPVPLDDAVVRIGGHELYEPRCERCWTEERSSVRAAP